MSGDQTTSGKIIVLADDLSGAAELAGIAFIHGLSAEVQRTFEPNTDTQLIAIDTDSRHLSPAAAADRVRKITEQVRAINPAWLYKKIDSVLRGNVRAEIEAILEATGQSRALLIPANPSRGRIIQGGRYHIDGVLLDETSFARDPEHPRRSPEVGALLGPTKMDPDPILIPDVSTRLDFHDSATQCESSTLLAGAADFFETLLSVRVNPSHPSHQCCIASPAPLRYPALLVCGSPAAWQQRQAACAAAGVLVTTIGERTGERTTLGALLLGIGESTSPEPLSALAQTAVTMIQRSSFATILAEGGATAAAIAEEMNWRRFQVVATAPAGVGCLKPVNDDTAPLFLIKPGSYPWPPEIWQAFCNC